MSLNDVSVPLTSGLDRSVGLVPTPWQSPPSLTVYDVSLYFGCWHSWQSVVEVGLAAVTNSELCGWDAGAPLQCFYHTQGSVCLLVHVSFYHCQFRV